jgi:flagellar protein FliS
MFGKPGSPARAYADLGRESDVSTASPHRLIVLLLEGAETAINVAKAHAEQGNIAERGINISKAIEIITNGLRVSLDIEHGGELAVRLAALYDYMVSRLLWANLKNDTSAMKEVLTLLGEIHSAWSQIDPDKRQ